MQLLKNSFVKKSWGVLVVIMIFLFPAIARANTNNLIPMIHLGSTGSYAIYFKWT